MASDSRITPSDFATSQLALLAAELAAETAQTANLLASTSPKTLSHAGLAILNLTPLSQHTGLGGKTVIELGPDPSVGLSEFPEHGIRTGDVVRVGPQPKGGEKKREKDVLERAGSEGVVVKVSKGTVQIAMEEGKGDEIGIEGRSWVVKLANEVTYRRMNWVMEKMRATAESNLSSLTKVLFAQETPAGVQGEGEEVNEWFDPTLNDSQKGAVRFALASRDIALIHGPPGTGKTYTLIELILQILKRNLRVLVCGPSNVSVDNIVERLAPHKISMIRLGHPARLLPSVMNHSLDVLTKTSEAGALVKDIRKEMDDKQASIKKTRSGRERKAIYAEIRDLRKEFREREKKCINTLVGRSSVVLATLHGSGGHQVRHEQFDVVIIDEASQALEAQCWIPLLTAKKVILAGDHLQLPPTIKSSNVKKSSKEKKTEEEETKGVKLETTLFDRLISVYGSSVKRMLTTQYRMHEKIMRFPADELYESQLIAAETVKQRLLKHLPYGVEDTDDTRESLVFWDTQGGDFPEKTEDDEAPSASKSVLLGDSKSNDWEAALVRQHVTSLISAGVHAEDIAVVTPYNAQLALLSKDLKEKYPGIELGSVDGFQGREKEAVVVSLVRSNSEHEVGFLGEKRRLNVAMTRPKRHLCVIGDSETVGKGSAFLRKWMKHLEDEADLRYPDVSEVAKESVNTR